MTTYVMSISKEVVYDKRIKKMGDVLLQLADEYICPITHELMVDPVLTDDQRLV